ncbi:MAG: hypothetical protein ACPHL8_06965 [Flavobacteriales bacterium]
MPSYRLGTPPHPVEGTREYEGCGRFRHHRCIINWVYLPHVCPQGTSYAQRMMPQLIL